MSAKAISNSLSIQAQNWRCILNLTFCLQDTASAVQPETYNKTTIQGTRFHYRIYREIIPGVSLVWVYRELDISGKVCALAHLSLSLTEIEVGACEMQGNAFYQSAYECLPMQKVVTVYNGKSLQPEIWLSMCAFRCFL